MNEYPHGFIATREAIKRIDGIRSFTDLGFPVLLMGPTGSAKTTSAKIALNNPELFSCSSETTGEQLLGRTILQKSGNEVTKFEEGPFTKAFRDGGCLIIDEINLAPPDILQCIEASLDSGNLELNSIGQNNYKPIPRNNNFKLVATMNPANEDYVKNRNKLLQKFQSKFKIIYFDNFDKLELKEIISKSGLDNESTINNFIKFHEFCAKRASKGKSYRCFTVRDIKLVLNCMSTNIPIDHAIYIIYCLCFPKSTREEYEKEFKKYWGEIPQIPIDNVQIQNCIRNPILSRSISTANILSVKNRQPLLLIGESNSGKTAIARWLSRYYHPSASQPMTVICTPETTNADLLGRHTIDASNQMQGNIKDTWVDGPVIRALEGGSVLLLDNINCAPSQVIERLNTLIDKAYLTDQTFHVNERPENQIVHIHENFRIIATAGRESIKLMSPALINRFAIVYIDNQFEDESETRQVFSDYIDTNVDSYSARNLIKSDLLKYKLKIKVIECINFYIKIKGLYKEISDKSIIEFSKNVFLGTNEDVGNDFADVIIKAQKNDDTQYFHFKQSPQIKKLMASLIALCNAGKHVVLQSQTGYGKTSAAEALGEILEIPVFKVAFNNETQIGELFGNYTISENGFNQKRGPLTEAMSVGGIFVADELNLAESSVLKSLRIAIEPKEGEEIELPNNEDTVTVSPRYFFIGCQNDISMIGRKKLPTDLTSKIVMLEYPLIGKDDLKNILRDIIFEMKSELMEYLGYTTDLMIQIRESELLKSKPWSFREARRFFRRILHFNKNTTIKPYYHAAFMLLGVHDNIDEKIIAEIHRVISESFRLKDEEKEALTKVMTSNVIADPKTKTLTKGEIVIKNIPIDVDPNLKQYWNSYFDIQMTHPHEPILISGPSGYKEFLAKKITRNNFKSVNLNKDSTTSSLIGGINLTDRKSVISMLFDILSRIDSDYSKYSECSMIKRSYFEDVFDEVKFNKFIESLHENKNNSIINVIEQIRSNILNLIHQKNDFSTLFSYYTTVFKPGLITSAILQQKPLILKNFSHPPISVIERLNELFSITPELTLREDFTNTIVPHKNQTIKVDNFRVFATTTVQEKSKLSEAMLSRLTVVKTKEYSKDDYQYIFDKMFYKFLMQKDFDDLSLNKKFMINNIARKVSNSLKNQKPERFFANALYMMNIIEDEMLYEPLNTRAGKIVSREIFVINDHEIKPKTNLVQTKSVNAMINLLFTAAKMKYNAIVQGPCGTGKSTAISYLAELFDADLMTVRISPSTTIESIYGQNELVQDEYGASFNFNKTALLKKITENASNRRPVWIVLEEIDQASDNLIDSLNQLFDSESDQILLPNGTIEKKNEYVMFGLSSKPFYNENILNNAVCIEQSEYPENEFVQICQQIIQDSNLAHNNEISEFPSVLYQWKQLAKEKQSPIPITIRTFKNFINLASQLPSKISFLKNQIYKTVFDEENPENKEEDEETEIRVENGYVSINDRTCTNYIQDERKQSLIQNMTKSQKNLFLILNASTKKCIPVIIQGKTASGKTHAMSLFAEAMGQNLITLQLNTETSDSIVYGGYKPLSELRPKQREEIQTMMNEVGRTFPAINQIKINSWVPVELHEIVNRLTTIKASIPNTVESLPIDNLIKKIINECQFYNLIEKYESIIVKAMKEGKWLLLDGIEACPSMILDRIITLFSQSPKLDLYERGINNEITAHPKFRVFMTYNPYEVTTRQRISQGLLNRCFIYTLDQIDNDFNDSFNVVFGIISQIKNLGFTNTNEVQKLVARVINVHLSQKQNQDVDGRTLIRIANSFALKAPLNRDKIIDSLEKNYSSKIEIDDEFKNNIQSKFNEAIDESKLKKFKNSVIIQSSELERLKKSLVEFKRSCNFSIQIFLQTFMRLPFENYEELQKVLTFDHQYIDIFVLINNFILESAKIIRREKKLEGQSLSTIVKNEFQNFDEFVSRIEAYLFIIEKYDINELEFKAIDLYLLSQINATNNINEALFFFLSMKNRSPEMFYQTSYMYSVAKGIEEIKNLGYKIILAEKEPNEVIDKTVIFYFKNKLMDKIYIEQKTIPISRIEGDLETFFSNISSQHKTSNSSFSNNSVDQEFRKSLSKKFIYMLYNSIFYSPKQLKGIFQDYASESYQISYDLIVKYKDLQMFKQWSDLLELISTTMNNNETLSLGAINWKNVLEKDSNLYNSLMSFDFTKFKLCATFNNLIRELKKMNIKIKEKKKNNKKRTSKSVMNEIQQYINLKQPNYEILQWAIDSNVFSEKTLPKDLLKMIDRANIEIYTPKQYHFKQLGDLFVSNNNDDVSWFYHYCLYSYKSYLIESTENGSLKSLKVLSEMSEDIKNCLPKVFTEGDLTSLYSYKNEITRELFQHLGEKKEFIKRSKVIDEVNKLINPSNYVSSDWEDVLEKIDNFIPLEIPFEIPPKTPSTITNFLYSSIGIKGFEYLSQSSRFMEYRENSINNPPTTFTDISNKVQEIFGEQDTFAAFCRSLDEDQCEFSFCDAMLYYNKTDLEFVPFQTLFLQKNPDMKQLMNLCLPQNETDSFHMIIGLIIIRLFSNSNLLIISSKITNDIHRLLREIINDWYKSPSQFLFDYLMKVEDYYKRNPQNTFSSLFDCIDIISGCIQQIDQMNIFIEQIRKDFGIAIKKYVGLSLNPYALKAYLEQQGNDIETLSYLQRHFKDLMKSSISYTKKLYEFILALTASPGSKMVFNYQSIVIYGCMTAISEFASANEIEVKFLTDYFKFVFKDFDLDLFEKIIKSIKEFNTVASNPQSPIIHDFVWNPLGSFVKEYNNALNEEIEKFKLELYEEDAKIKRMHSLDLYTAMSNAISKDKKDFVDAFNRDKIDEEKLIAWKEYSQYVKALIINIPLLNDTQNPKLPFSVQNFLKLLENPPIYTNAEKITILYVKKMHTEYDYFEIEDKLIEGDERILKKSCQNSFMIFRLNPDRNESEFEINECIVKRYTIYYEKDVQMAQACEIKDVLDKAIKFNKIKSPNKLIFETDSLEVCFGNKTETEFLDELITYSKVGLNEFDKRIINYGRPILKYKEDYEMKATYEQYNSIKRVLEDSQNSSRNIDQYNNCIEELSSKQIKNIYTCDFDHVKLEIKKLQIQFNKLKIEQLLTPILVVQGDKVTCSFKTIDVEIVDVPQYAITPFAIRIPIVGQIPKEEIFLADSDDIQIKYDNDSLIIKAKPVSNATLTATLNVMNLQIPIKIKFALGNIPIYIKSGDNKFINDGFTSFFKSVTFKNEKISVTVEDGNKNNIPHTLTFQQGTSSKQKCKPTYEYNEQNCESIFYFKEVDSADMIVYVHISNMNPIPIPFRSEIIERPIIFKTWNISKGLFDDSTEIWAGDLLCNYAFSLMTYLPNENGSIKVEITTSTDNINLKLAGDKVGTKTYIHSIKSDGKNKIAHQIPFAICFNNREDKVEKLFIKIKFAELIFEKQITVIPCYIRFTKTAINVWNPKINFDFDVPQRSPAPICNGKYYIFDSQKFLEIDNHTKMKEEDSYHVVTPFSYNVYSLNEPNQYTTIHYNENHQIQYQKNVLNFSYFVIDRNGKYYVVHKNDLKEDHQIVCGRLCQSDIRTTGKDKAQEKWQNCWFPFTDDKEAIKQLFSNHQKNIYHMIYMTKSILEFIRLPYDESLAAKNILNYIVDIFYHRLEALNKQKGHLRTDVDIKLIFETRKSCQIDIPLNPINEILNTTDELFKRDLQRIVNGFTPERRISFIRVMSEILKDSPVYSKQDKTEKDYQYLLQNVFKYSPLNILMKKVLDFIKSKSLIISVDDEKTNVVDSIITKYKGAPVKNNSEFNSLIEREIKDVKRPGMKTIGSFIEMIQSAMILSQNLPFFLSEIIEKGLEKEKKDDTDRLFNELVYVNDWCTSISAMHNNPLIKLAKLYMEYFQKLKNSMYNNENNANSYFIIPTAIPPNVYTKWDVEKKDEKLETTDKPKIQEEKEVFIEKPTKFSETKDSHTGKVVSKIMVDITTDDIQKNIIESMKFSSNEIKLRLTENELGEDSTSQTVGQNLDISKVECIIKCALPLASAIMRKFINSGISLGNKEVAILLDSSSTINEANHRNSVFTMFVSMAIAFENLHIPTNLYVFCDTRFQFFVKSSKQLLKREHIQVALDAFSVFRKISNVGDAISKIKNPDVSTVFVITDGLLYNLHDTQGYQDLLKDRRIKINFLVLSVLKDEDFETMKNYIDNSLKLINEKNAMMFASYIKGLEKAFKSSGDLADIINKGLLIDNKVSHHHTTDFKTCTICDEANFEFKDIDVSSKKYSSRYNEALEFSPDEIFDIPQIEDTQFITRCKKQKEISFDGLSQIKKVQNQILNSFEPNKPTQFSQSTKGSNISIKGYIQFLVTQGQEQRIYLEKNAGFVLSQSLFVVIDASISCFNEHACNQSLQTIICTLNSLRIVDFDTVTILISRGNETIEICHEVSNTDLFVESSPVWSAIVNICTSPSMNSDIISTLACVDDIRAKQQSKQSLCLCFTDCMLNSQELKALGTIITQLESRKTPVYSIGIGLDPSKIAIGFKYSFWSMNPIVIPIAIMKAFRGIFSPEKIIPFIDDKVLEEDFNKLTDIIQDNNRNYVYTDIYKKLDEIIRLQETYSAYYNQEAASTRIIETEDVDGSTTEGSQASSSTTTTAATTATQGGSSYTAPSKKYTAPIRSKLANQDEIKDLGKGKIWAQTILICQFWDYCMMPSNTKGESEYISKKTLEGPKGIIKAVSDLGMKCTIVQNYKDSIEALMSGEYSQAWVICGRGENKKPNELNNDGTSYLIDQFIDCLIEFNKNGGALLIAGDNNPLTFELNKFLEKVELDGKKPQFRFGVDEPGKNMLRFGDIDSDDAQLFDKRSMIKVPGSERPLYGFNVKTLYEGTTISCAPGDADISPFQPFIISRGGNYANLYYMAPLNSDAGDIILDGSFTRFFNELHEEGTLRFVRNIAVWLLSVERRERNLHDYKRATTWKAKKFDFNIKDVDKSKVQYNTFSSGQDIDICFVVDGTKSMNNERGKVHKFEEKANDRSMITGAKSIFKKLMEYTKKKYSDLNVRYSANFFRDAAMAEQLYRHKKQGHGTVDYNVATPFDFKEHGGSINPVEFDKVETNGGAGDGPEDWVQAFEGMFKFHWKPQAKKIMIMITDAGGHGEKFNSKPDRDDEDKEIDRTEGPKVERLIRRIAEEKIDVCFIYTHWNAKQGMKEFKRIYEEAGGSNFKSIEETFANAGQELRQTVSDLITSIVDTAVASFNTSKVKEITLAADAKLPKRKKREQISLEINDQPKSIPNEKSGRKKERVVSGVVEYEEKSQESTPVEVVSETQTTEEGLNKFKDEINSHRNDIKAIEQKVKEQKMTRMINMESIPPAPANIQTANQYFVQSNQQQQGMQGMQMPPPQQQQQEMQMLPQQQQQGMQMPPQQQQQGMQMPPPQQQQQEMQMLPPQQQQQGMQMLPQQQQQGMQMLPQQQQQGMQMLPQQQQQGMQMPPPQQQQQGMQMPPPQQQQQEMQMLPQQQQQGMQMLPQQQQQGMQMLPQQQQQGMQMLPPQQQQQGMQMLPQQQQQGMQMPPPQQQQQEMQMPPPQQQQQEMQMLPQQQQQGMQMLPQQQQQGMQMLPQQQQQGMQMPPPQQQQQGMQMPPPQQQQQEMQMPPPQQQQQEMQMLPQQQQQGMQMLPQQQQQGMQMLPQQQQQEMQMLPQQQQQGMQMLPQQQQQGMQMLPQQQQQEMQMLPPQQQQQEMQMLPQQQQQGMQMLPPQQQQQEMQMLPQQQQQGMQMLPQQQQQEMQMLPQQQQQEMQMLPQQQQQGMQMLPQQQQQGMQMPPPQQQQQGMQMPPQQQQQGMQMPPPQQQQQEMQMLPQQQQQGMQMLPQQQQQGMQMLPQQQQQGMQMPPPQQQQQGMQMPPPQQQQQEMQMLPPQQQQQEMQMLPQQQQQGMQMLPQQQQQGMQMPPQQQQQGMQMPPPQQQQQEMQMLPQQQQQGMQMLPQQQQQGMQMLPQQQQQGMQMLPPQQQQQGMQMLPQQQQQGMQMPPPQQQQQGMQMPPPQQQQQEMQMLPPQQQQQEMQMLPQQQQQGMQMLPQQQQQGMQMPPQQQQQGMQMPPQQQQQEMQMLPQQQQQGMQMLPQQQQQEMQMLPPQQQQQEMQMLPQQQQQGMQMLPPQQQQQGMQMLPQQQQQGMQMLPQQQQQGMQMLPQQQQQEMQMLPQQQQQGMQMLPQQQQQGMQMLPQQQQQGMQMLPQQQQQGMKMSPAQQQGFNPFYSIIQQLSQLPPDMQIQFMMMMNNMSQLAMQVQNPTQYPAQSTYQYGTPIQQQYAIPNQFGMQNQQQQIPQQNQLEMSNQFGMLNQQQLIPQQNQFGVPNQQQQNQFGMPNQQQNTGFNETRNTRSRNRKH